MTPEATNSTMIKLSVDVFVEGTGNRVGVAVGVGVVITAGAL